MCPIYSLPILILWSSSGTEVNETTGCLGRYESLIHIIAIVKISNFLKSCSPAFRSSPPASGLGSSTSPPAPASRPLSLTVTKSIRHSRQASTSRDVQIKEQSECCSNPAPFWYWAFAGWQYGSNRKDKHIRMAQAVIVTDMLNTTSIAASLQCGSKLKTVFLPIADCVLPGGGSWCACKSFAWAAKFCWNCIRFCQFCLWTSAPMAVLCSQDR